MSLVTSLIVITNAKNAEDLIVIRASNNIFLSIILNCVLNVVILFIYVLLALVNLNVVLVHKGIIFKILSARNAQEENVWNVKLKIKMISINCVSISVINALLAHILHLVKCVIKDII